MKIYFAPMEGITGYIFRNEFENFFGGIDKYFTPFISPMEKKILRNKEAKDVAFKMKELWAFWGDNFENQKAVHKMRISKNASEYEELFKMLEKDYY